MAVAVRCLGMSSVELGLMIHERVLEHARGRAPRALVVFANPLGNSMGDTVIATQHIAFLRRIPGIDISVWTTNGDVWRSIGGKDIRIYPAVGERELAFGFDLIVLDWINLGPDFWPILARSNAIVMSWENRNGNLRIRVPPGSFQEVDLPPTINHPARIGEMYAALGWSPIAMTSLSPAGATDRTSLYFNPYASTAEKSLRPAIASELLVAMDGILPPTVPIQLGPRPRPLSFYESKAFDALEAAVRAAQTPRMLVPEEPGPVDKYVDAVRRAVCVVCPDTSTQHVAAVCRTPSIVLYAPRKGYNHYAYGWQSAEAFNLQMVEDGTDGGLNDIVCRLTAALFQLPPHAGTRSFKRLAHALSELAAFLRGAECVDFFDSRPQTQLRENIAKVEALLPNLWKPYLLPELQQVASELSTRDTLLVHGPTLIRNRVRMIASLRVGAKLASYAS
jgi:hypothetical protein